MVVHPKQLLEPTLTPSKSNAGCSRQQLCARAAAGEVSSLRCPHQHHDVSLQSVDLPAAFSQEPIPSCPCSLKEATDLVAGLLGGQVRLFTTQCVMHEIKALGHDYAGVQDTALQQMINIVESAADLR